MPPDHGKADIDLVYFDADDLSAATEEAHEARLRDTFTDIGLKLDLKNQARVHLWYPDRFGFAIPPYRSAAQAIATFPTTSAAVGIRPGAEGLEIVAPFGLVPVATGLGGAIYLAVASLGGLAFLWAAIRVFMSRAGEPDARQDMRRAHVLFGVSIIYLFALFAALLVEHALPLHFAIPGVR